MREQKIVWNLCDRSFHVLDNGVTKMLSMAGLSAKVDDVIQLGSYTCANYFIKLLEWMADEIQDDYDLVIPVIPEHRLDILESKAFIGCIDRCRQVVVNDFGVLEYLQNKYVVRMGRHFFKDYRDKRYKEYDSAEYDGKADTVLKFVEKCGIRVAAYENDIITQNYYPPTGLLDKQPDLYLHYPYRLLSMSHICEYASIGKRIEDKYIPDDSCTMQCFRVNTRSDEFGYMKIGKGVYEALEDKYLNNIDGSYHLIITPRW